jgi:putative transposase
MGCAAVVAEPSAQRSKPVAFLLADLGVTKTHSRPYTSSDNPYSESNFKTLKYRPEFFSWAAERWPADRFTVQLAPWQLSPSRDEP